MHRPMPNVDGIILLVCRGPLDETCFPLFNRTLYRLRIPLNGRKMNKRRRTNDLNTPAISTHAACGLLRGSYGLIGQLCMINGH
jgi:hypothetical protein